MNQRHALMGTQFLKLMARYLPFLFKISKCQFRIAVQFGWDNEFPELELEVGDFVIDRTPVRNSEFEEFVGDGGYQRPELWRDEDWQWRSRVGLLPSRPVSPTCSYFPPSRPFWP